MFDALNGGSQALISAYESVGTFGAPVRIRNYLQKLLLHKDNSHFQLKYFGSHSHNSSLNCSLVELTLHFTRVCL